MNPNTKVLLGALVAAGLAIAGYYGLISPQQATSIQNQANQTLGTGPQGQTGQVAPNGMTQAQGAAASQARTSQPSTATQPAPATAN